MVLACAAPKIDRAIRCLRSFLPRILTEPLQTSEEFSIPNALGMWVNSWRRLPALLGESTAVAYTAVLSAKVEYGPLLTPLDLHSTLSGPHVVQYNVKPSLVTTVPSRGEQLQRSMQCLYWHSVSIITSASEIREAGEAGETGKAGDASEVSASQHEYTDDNW